MMSEYVVLVDKHDREIGVQEKLQAHLTAALHRAFSVFLFRFKHEKLQVLLQQRQQNKYHCGGLWTNACCSHPRLGEDVLAAGVRRLKEELNIIDVKLARAGTFVYRAELDNGLVEHEYDHVLVGDYQQDKIVFNPDEVQATRWVDIAILQDDLKKCSDSYTPWLLQSFELALHYALSKRT